MKTLAGIPHNIYDPILGRITKGLLKGGRNQILLREKPLTFRVPHAGVIVDKKHASSAKWPNAYMQVDDINAFVVGDIVLRNCLLNKPKSCKYK